MTLAAIPTRFRSARTEVRRSVLTGLLLALLVLAGGLGLALTQAESWTAESVVVVLPSSTLDTTNSAAYYETLSRGQIVATFAEVAGNLRFAQQAEISLNLTAAQRQGISTVVSVVPNTSVILVRATASSATVAEQVADATTSLSSTYLSGLSNPYRTDTVHAAQGSAYSSGTSPVLLALVSLIVALVAGVGLQQAVYHLMSAIRREPAVTAQAGTAPEESPPSDEPVPVNRPAAAFRPDLPSRRASRQFRYGTDRQEHVDGNRRPVRSP